MKLLDLMDEINFPTVGKDWHFPC